MAAHRTLINKEGHKTRSYNLISLISLIREAERSVGWPTSHPALKSQESVIGSVSPDKVDAALAAVNLRRCD